MNKTTEARRELIIAEGAAKIEKIQSYTAVEIEYYAEGKISVKERDAKINAIDAIYRRRLQAADVKFYGLKNIEDLYV